MNEKKIKAKRNRKKKKMVEREKQVKLFGE